jgi:5-methyltetrahydropteroyltriglutamate--homocysteine methyltransferase
MSQLPLFPVTVVGSWPRSRPLLNALRAFRRGDIEAAEFDQVADAAVLEALRIQEGAGLDIVSDGEQRRDNFYSFVAEKLEGVRLMSLAEMLDVVEDKAAFEKILQTLDVPAYSILNPTCVGKVRRKAPMAAHELQFLKEHTDKPVKIPLPGPYLLTRAMWVREVAAEHYPTKEDLGDDIVKVLIDEVVELTEGGADFIQFDEPVLTELVFTQGQTRTFMCAALAARKDPQEELEFAVNLLNRVIAGAREELTKRERRLPRTGLHVCRGNWSQDETTLLEGSYRPLAPFFERMEVDQLVLEYATPRAKDLIDFGQKELGLGVTNPRTPDVEPTTSIVERAREAMEHVAPEKLFLNPDCGFGTFSSRPMNTSEIAQAKLRAMVAAAATLRAEV